MRIGQEYKCYQKSEKCRSDLKDNTCTALEAPFRKLVELNGSILPSCAEKT